jgi:hypothetical protein
MKVLKMFVNEHSEGADRVSFQWTTTQKSPMNNCSQGTFIYMFMAIYIFRFGYLLASPVRTVVTSIFRAPFVGN